MTLSLGVDIGGTKVLAGVVDRDGHVRDRARRDTGESADQIADAIVAAIEELLSAHEVMAIGLSAAGFISADRTTVLASPNIPAWKGVALADEISQRIARPVVLENDANAAAWAEARFGAGAGRSHVFVVTVGTGIGGGIVMDGHLVRGGFGIAGEPGHMVMVPDGLPCGCGQRGCWEQYGSGSALVRSARARSVDHLERSGAQIMQAAQSGDEAAVAAFNEIGDWLGRGLASIAALLDPELIIVGGGVSHAGALLLDPIKRSFSEHLPASAMRPHAEIVTATFAGDAGMIGAADLARHP